MPASPYYQIVTALVGLLEADPPVADAIYRARSRVVPQSINRAVNVVFEGSVPHEGAINGAPIDWTSRFTLDCFARAAAGEENDQAIEAVLTAVYNRIAADTTLGGLVGEVGAPLIETEYAAEGERTNYIRLTYAIEHRTEQSTLE